MNSENEELLSSFVEESGETLADIENDLLTIESSGGDIDEELVNRVFRGIHSMKGAAGFLGLTSVGSLAHEAENILNLIRNRELKPTSAVINALLKAADALRKMIADIHASNTFDVSAYVQELKQAVNRVEDEAVREAADRDIDITLPDGRCVFVMVKELQLMLRRREGHHIYVVETDLFADVEQAGINPLEFLNKVYASGELIDSYMRVVGIGDIHSDLPDSMIFVLLIGSRLERQPLSAQLGVPQERIYKISEAEAEKAEGTFMQQESGAVEANSPIMSETAPQGECETASTAGAVPDAAGDPSGNALRQTSLRVNVKVLDTLMNLAGELVLGRNQLLQEAGSRDHRGIESVAARIDQVTSELQEAIMQTRMQPIGNVFNKFPRIVRDLSGKLDKQCELQIEGKDVEMDKAIIEAINDPLTHLVRNSIDHGIEMPQERSARGKKPVGVILLRAYHQAGKINISIIDDGAGINTEKLKKKAVEKGILAADRAKDLSQRDAVRLIFHPGLSTAEAVSDISGRGVGMDVVRTNIERLGGTIDIDTEVGKGTTIVIKLPLTLAIIPSLIVRIASNRFAIPQVNISELVRIKATEIKEKIDLIKNAEVLRLRGNLLPLIRLSVALGMQSMYRDPKTGELKMDRRAQLAPDTDVQKKNASATEHTERRNNNIAGAINIIVVESGHLRYGLIVDELFDSKEIVVKPLGRHIKDSPCLAGATILGDGNVSLILDISGIASHLQLTVPDEEENQDEEARVDADGEETQSTLIFSNHPQEYFGVPAEFVTRIERIRAEQIDTVGGQEVLQYRGGSLPLLSLEKLAKTKPRPEAPSLYVIVFRISGTEVGLIAPDLVDITSLTTHIDTATFREKGIIGSIVSNERTVRLVDVFELAETAHPEWFTQAQRRGTKAEQQRPSCILLAEDSSFFRQQMGNFLESEGYQVIACEDGRIALDTLKERFSEVALVITDIEMPNMDGLSLTRAIRQEPDLLHLPVIAVTSLASESDVERGKQAGVDEYHVKLDRDQLLAATRRLTKTGRPAPIAAKA